MKVTVFHFVVIVAVAVFYYVSFSDAENRVVLDNIDALLEQLYSSAVEVFILMFKGDFIKLVIFVFESV